jgi:predicted kinase
MSVDTTLHFFCGKAGAGKSTVAARIASDCNAILLSEDVWMMRLFGDQMKVFEDYIRLSRKLKEVIGPLTVDLLTAGQSVVLDFQANTKAGRSWFRSIFETAQTSHVLHFVKTPDELCLERIGKRNRERPEGSHHLTEEDFLHVSSFFQAPEDSEGFNIRTYAS